MGDFGKSGEFGDFGESGESGESGEFGESGDFSKWADSGGSIESGDSSESGDQKIYGLYGVECHKVEKRPGWVCFGWVGLVGQWSVGPWIAEMWNFTHMADIFV